MIDVLTDETLAVSREALACRMLDSALTDVDKDFLRTARVRGGARATIFRNSKRLRELLEIGEYAPGAAAGAAF